MTGSLVEAVYKDQINPNNRLCLSITVFDYRNIMTGNREHIVGSRKI